MMRDEAINHYNVIGANDIIFGFFFAAFFLLQKIVFGVEMSE